MAAIVELADVQKVYLLGKTEASRRSRRELRHPKG